MRYRSLTKNEGKTSSEVEPDSETLQLTTFADVQALLLFDDEMVQESDKDDVLEDGEEMDDDIPPTKEEAQSPPLNQKQPESSHAQEQFDESDSEPSCLAVLKKYDNILPLTERQLDRHEEVAASYVDLRAYIEDYYDENVDHKDQTKKLVKETLMTLDNISLTKLINNAKLSGLLTKLEGFQSSLNTLSTQCASISESLKEDPEFNQRLLQAAEGYIQNSARLNEFSKHLSKNLQHKKYQRHYEIIHFFNQRDGH
ncbi:hypothetical protein Tco_1546905 [Tanacetum coccineum]